MMYSHKAFECKGFPCDIVKCFCGYTEFILSLFQSLGLFGMCINLTITSCSIVLYCKIYRAIIYIYISLYIGDILLNI